MTLPVKYVEFHIRQSSSLLCNMVGYAIALVERSQLSVSDLNAMLYPKLTHPLPQWQETMLLQHVLTEYERLLVVIDMWNTDFSLPIHNVFIPIVMISANGIVYYTGGQFKMTGNLIVIHEGLTIISE